MGYNNVQIEITQKSLLHQINCLCQSICKTPRSSVNGKKMDKRVFRIFQILLFQLPKQNHMHSNHLSASNIEERCKLEVLKISYQLLRSNRENDVAQFKKLMYQISQQFPACYDLLLLLIFQLSVKSIAPLEVAHHPNCISFKMQHDIPFVLKSNSLHDALSSTGLAKSSKAQQECSFLQSKTFRHRESFNLNAPYFKSQSLECRKLPITRNQQIHFTKGEKVDITTDALEKHGQYDVLTDRILRSTKMEATKGYKKGSPGWKTFRQTENGNLRNPSMFRSTQHWKKNGIGMLCNSTAIHSVKTSVRCALLGIESSLCKIDEKAAKFYLRDPTLSKGANLLLIGGFYPILQVAMEVGTCYLKVESLLSNARNMQEPDHVQACTTVLRQLLQDYRKQVHKEFPSGMTDISVLKIPEKLQIVQMSSKILTRLMNYHDLLQQSNLGLVNTKKESIICDVSIATQLVCNMLDYFTTSEIVKETSSLVKALLKFVVEPNIKLSIEWAMLNTHCNVTEANGMSSNNQCNLSELEQPQRALIVARKRISALHQICRNSAELFRCLQNNNVSMNVNTDNQHRPSLRIATSSRIYEIICYSIKQCEAARDAIAIARLERTYTMRRQANILNLALKARSNVARAMQEERRNKMQAILKDIATKNYYHEMQVQGSKLQYDQLTEENKSRRAQEREIINLSGSMMLETYNEKFKALEDRKKLATWRLRRYKMLTTSRAKLRFLRISESDSWKRGNTELNDLYKNKDIEAENSKILFIPSSPSQTPNNSLPDIATSFKKQSNQKIIDDKSTRAAHENMNSKLEKTWSLQTVPDGTISKLETQCNATTKNIEAPLHENSKVEILVPAETDAATSNINVHIVKHSLNSEIQASNNGQNLCPPYDTLNAKEISNRTDDAGFKSPIAQSFTHLDLSIRKNMLAQLNDTNQAVLHLFFNEYRLLQWLEYVHDICFLSGSYQFTSFMSTQEYAMKQCNLYLICQHANNLLRSTLCPISDSTNICHFRYAIDQYNTTDNTELTNSMLKLCRMIRLELKVSEPLDFLLSGTETKELGNIHQFMLQLHTLAHLRSCVWKKIMNTQDAVLSKRMTSYSNFLQAIHGFAVHDVILPERTAFMNNLVEVCDAINLQRFCKEFIVQIKNALFISDKILFSCLESCLDSMANYFECILLPEVQVAVYERIDAEFSSRKTCLLHSLRSKADSGCSMRRQARSLYQIIRDSS